MEKTMDFAFCMNHSCDTFYKKFYDVFIKYFAWK